MSNSNAGSGGVGVLGLLGVVFVTLKLTGYIDWNWWWVTAPFWIPFAIIIVAIVVMLTLALASPKVADWLEGLAKS